MSVSANTKLFIEVLQNGFPVCSHSYPIAKRKRIKLFNSLRATLSIPYYPLAGSLDIGTITKRQFVLRANKGWRGFIVSQGNLHEIRETPTAKRRYSLKSNDYASISKSDITILIKIAKEKVARPVRKSGDYSGSLLRLFFGEKHGAVALLAGLAATSLILGGFTMGLLSRKPTTPQKLEDLGARYTLPMISAKHLETLPEALQMNLNRKAPVSAAISYYRNISLLVSGYPIEDDRLLFSSSLGKWHADHTSIVDKASKLDSKQKEVDRRYGGLDNVALLNIPAIPQESNIEAMARIKDKIGTMHQSFEYTLEKRRATTAEFASDTSYDFEDYRAPAKKGNSALSQISVFSMLTDEEAMYQEAKSLARKSEVAKDLVKKNMKGVADQDESHLIVIKPNDSYVSATVPTDFKGLNNKIYAMRSSLYEHATGKVAEPMLGELDKGLIEEIVDSNQYQLQLCFELALKRNRNTAGRMEWQWVLNSKGQITAIDLVASTIKDPQMAKCVKEKILGWKFPRPRHGSIEIVHPFVFKPAKG
jgi:hypothetical protein